VVDLAGTGMSLHYESDQQLGNAAPRTFTIPLSGATVPTGLQQIKLIIQVAGQSFTSSFAPAPNQSTTFTWDGKDAYGRVVQGTQYVTVQIGYVYPAVWMAPSQSNNFVFGMPGGGVTQNAARKQITVWQAWTLQSKPWDDRSRGLAGWSISTQHVYDPGGKVLYLGNGQQRSADALAAVISRIAGTGVTGYSGDGGPATQAQLQGPWGVAAGPDGSIYVTDTGGLIRRVDPNGIITTFAGTGTAGYSGDGGPATRAQLFNPSGIAVAPDGSVYDRR
jgi:hypothetical protein